MLLVISQPIPVFGLGHYRSIASSTIFFSPHKSLPPKLLFQHNQRCIAGKVSRSLCLPHKEKGNFFTFSNNKSQQVFVAFVGTKLGNSSRVVARRQYRRGWSVGTQRHCVGSNRLPQLLLPSASHHPRSAGVLDFAFGPQAYPNIWGVRSRRMRWTSRTLENFLIQE